MLEEDIVLLEPLLSILQLTVILVQQSFNQLVRLVHLLGLLPSWSTEKDVDSFLFVRSRGGERSMRPISDNDLLTAGRGHLSIVELAMRVYSKRLF